MKKRILSFLLILILPLCLSFTGCKEDGKEDDEWVEIQSINYTFNGQNSIKSTIKWNISSVEITEQEYNESNEIKEEPSILQDIDINVNRQDYFKKLNNYKSTYYLIESDFGNDTRYFKYNIVDYEIRYVKVKFIDENTIELKYYDDIVTGYITEKIQTESYKMTYFND